MDYKKLNLGSRDQWQESLQGIETTPFHSWKYCRTVSNSTGLKIHLHVFEDDKKKCLIPLSTREKMGVSDFVTPYGFSGFAGHKKMLSSDYFKEAFLNCCAENGYISAYIMQSPHSPLSKKVWGEQIYEDHRLYIIDLSRDRTRLWKALGKGHQYDLKKIGNDQNSRLVESLDRLIPALKSLYPETLERVGASAVYQFDNTALQSFSGMERSLLLGWEDESGIQAVSLFLVSNSGYVGEYFLNASTIKGRMYSKSLLWEAFYILGKRGVRFLNIGGGAAPGDFLDDFKEGLAEGMYWVKP